MDSTIKKSLDKKRKILYTVPVAGFYLFLSLRYTLGLSPNGKATDSDSVISRFESL